MSSRANDWGVRMTTHLPLVLRLRIRRTVTSRVKDKSAFNLLAPRVGDRHVITAKRGRASSLTSKSRPETLYAQFTRKRRLEYSLFTPTSTHEAIQKNFDFQARLTLMDDFNFEVYRSK